MYVRSTPYHVQSCLVYVFIQEYNIFRPVLQGLYCMCTDPKNTSYRCVFKRHFNGRDVNFLKLNVLLEINGLLICSQYDDILQSREFI